LKKACLEDARQLLITKAIRTCIKPLRLNIYRPFLVYVGVFSQIFFVHFIYRTLVWKTL